MATDLPELVSDVPVFRPTWEEFQDFAGYVARIEKSCEFAGLIKVIPPPEWVARAGGYDDVLDTVVVKDPVKQEFMGKGGVFTQFNLLQRSMPLSAFKRLAESPANRPPNLGRLQHADDDDEPAPAMTKAQLYAALERKYWQGVHSRQPTYGADMAFSLMDKTQTTWNLSDLRTMLDRLPRKIPGVNIPYLYFGMWGATFSWHVEDMDLYSINYLHFGAPKHWYSVSPLHRRHFEEVAKTHFHIAARQCPEFLRHKMSLISPSTLSQSRVIFHRVVQEPGEFIVTLPGAYHAGFNHGFNCAEAVNFALDAWVPVGAKAKSCQCKKDSVRIDMRLFLPEPEPEPEPSLEHAEDAPAAAGKPPRRSAKRSPAPPKEEPRPEAPADYRETDASLLPFPVPQEDDACAVCFRAVDGRATWRCKRCQLPVHFDCHGYVGEPPAAGDFMCVRCICSLPLSTPCIACPRFGGALKATDALSWCHILCGALVPELSFGDDGEYEFIVGVADVPPSRRRLKCTICGLRGGFAVQCANSKCAVAFHASCAVAAGLPLMNDPQQPDDPRALVAYCRTHDARRHERRRQIMEAAAGAVRGAKAGWALVQSHYHPCIIEEELAARPFHFLVSFPSDGSVLEVPATAITLTKPSDELLAPTETAPAATSSEEQPAVGEGSAPPPKRQRREVDYAALNNGLYTN